MSKELERLDNLYGHLDLELDYLNANNDYNKVKLALEVLDNIKKFSKYIHIGIDIESEKECGATVILGDKKQSWLIYATTNLEEVNSLSTIKKFLEGRE